MTGAPIAFAQCGDSLKTYEARNVTVFGHRYAISSREFPVVQTELASVLRLGGFHLVDEGASFAQDIYADGLSRGNYTIVVDGERCQSACPMRMDAPISGINPLDVQSIDLVKSSANLQAGPGGVVAIHRSLPTEKFGLEGSLTQLLGRSKETDFALSTEKSMNRTSVRYIEGGSVRDGQRENIHRALWLQPECEVSVR